MIQRRRFLQIVVGAAAGSALYNYTPNRTQWRGTVFGADAHLIINGDTERARAALHAVKQQIEQLEQSFSLYRHDSEISQLNQNGLLTQPGQHMRQLLETSRQIWQDSSGAFDPTIGGLWRQLALGLQGQEVDAPVDFSRLTTGLQIHIPKNMAITLNGIAQGYASDVIAARLRDYGFDKTLVNMGEYVASQGPWYIGVEDKSIRLTDLAVASSRADATLLPGGRSHILGADATAPQWHSVTVIAETGVLADGWSTAFMLMSKAQIDSVRQRVAGIRRVWLG